MSFARRILRQCRNRDVETSETRQAAEYEKREKKVVQRCSKTKREGGDGGSDPKRDLEPGSDGVDKWMGNNRTRSASESSSCPIKDDFFRQRATFPSMKSKKSPNGMNASANQRLV